MGDIFFDVKHLTKEDKICLIKDAIEKSTNYHVDKLDLDIAYHRITIKNANVFEYLDIIIEQKNNFVFIIRNPNNQTQHIETGIASLGYDPEYYIFIYLDIKEFDFFRKKFNIIKKL